MLFVKESGGQYVPAPEKAILDEAKRVSRRFFKRGASINSPDAAREAIGHLLGRCQNEMFYCLFMDAQNRVLKWVEMFKGSVSQTTIHPREVVKEALRLNAVGVILVHNHPSGSTRPSSQDINLTQELRKILGVIDVRVLDHLIVGEDVMSMSEAGFLA